MRKVDFADPYWRTSKNKQILRKLYHEYLAIVKSYSGPAPSFEKWAAIRLRKEKAKNHENL